MKTEARETPLELEVGPPSEAPPWEPDPPGPLELTSQGLALAFDGVTFALVLGTAATMAVLGPFGFFPALLIGPAFAAAEVCQAVSDRLRARRLAQPHAERTALTCSDVPTAPAEVAQTAEVTTTDTATVRPKRRTTYHLRLARCLRQVEDQHHSLPLLLAAVEAKGDPLETLIQLRALKAYLEEHFREEEAPGGLFEELQSLDPSAAEHVGKLAHEHEQILADLEALTNLEGTNAGPRPSRGELVTRLRAHQHYENELIQQVYGFRIPGELGV